MLPCYIGLGLQVPPAGARCCYSGRSSNTLPSLLIQLQMRAVSSLTCPVHQCAYLPPPSLLRLLLHRPPPTSLPLLLPPPLRRPRQACTVACPRNTYITSACLPDADLACAACGLAGCADCAVAGVCSECDTGFRLYVCPSSMRHPLAAPHPRSDLFHSSPSRLHLPRTSPVCSPLGAFALTPAPAHLLGPEQVRRRVLHCLSHPHVQHHRRRGRGHL